MTKRAAVSATGCSILASIEDVRKGPCQNSGARLPLGLPDISRLPKNVVEQGAHEVAAPRADPVFED